MKDIYPHQEIVQVKRSLIERISQSRLVQTSALGTVLFGAAACSAADSGRGDVVPGVQLNSQVLILANADGFPNTSIQCLADTAIFSNTRTGGPQTVIPHQPDLCAAVAKTLDEHISADGKAIQIDHLSCPDEPIDKDFAQVRRAYPELDIGLCS